MPVRLSVNNFGKKTGGDLVNRTPVSERGYSMNTIPEDQPKSIHEKIADEYRIRYLAGDDFIDECALEIVAEMLIEREIYEAGA